MKKSTNDVFDKSLPKNLPLLLQSRANQYGDIVSQASKNSEGVFQYYTYKQTYQETIALAVKLMDLGIKRGHHIGFISDNRREWLITDFAILSLGACDVPRGCDSMGNEIRYILNYSDCEVSVFENDKQLKKVLENTQEVPNLKKAILFDCKDDSVIEQAKQSNIEIFMYSDLVESGKEILEKQPHQKAIVESEMQMTDENEVATMIFTSGTTGTPKGVMLTHRNFLAQMEVMHVVLPVHPGDMWLSVLPVWHSFERVVQYISVTLCSGLAYSKPVASLMLPDMAKIKPQCMCGVPRLWESLATGVYRSMKKAGGIKYAMFKFFISVGKKYAWCKEHVTGCVCQFKKRFRFFDTLIAFIPLIVLYPLHAIGNSLVYKKIKEKLGGNIVCAISGGGALQKDIEGFYRAIDLQLLEGYGMTETAPVLSFRDYKKPRPGCVGLIMPCVQVKVVSEENGNIIDTKPLPPGKRGLILAKGDQIMKGYYKRKDLTDKIIDKDGWLNTGDLGMLTYDNEIKITGRAKDTIVLLGGENVEPAVIESALCASEYIESCVVLGQDKKYLTALIVPFKDSIMDYAKEIGIPNEYYEGVLESPEVKILIQEIIDKEICAANGFRACERIYKFDLLPESFKVGEELSAKQEMKRYVITEKYKARINKLFSE